MHVVHVLDRNQDLSWLDVETFNMYDIEYTSNFHAAVSGRIPMQQSFKQI